MVQLVSNREGICPQELFPKSLGGGVRVNLAVLGLPGREGRLGLEVFLAFSWEGTAASLPPVI